MSEGAEIIDFVEASGEVARHLHATVRIAVRDDGTGVMSVHWRPGEPPRLRGIGLQRFQQIRDQALARAAEVAGQEVEVVLQ